MCIFLLDVLVIWNNNKTLCDLDIYHFSHVPEGYTFTCLSSKPQLR